MSFYRDCFILSTLLRTMVSISPTFYGWLFQFSGKMRPLSPEPVVDEYRKMLENALNHLSLRNGRGALVLASCTIGSVQIWVLHSELPVPGYN